MGNAPNEKLFVYKKWSTYQKIGDVLFLSADSYLATLQVIGLVNISGIIYKKSKETKEAS